MLVYMPTNTCFDDCANALNDMALDNPDLLLHVHLVHGIMLANPGLHDDTLTPDQPFAHCWLEIGDVVFHPAIAPDGVPVLLHCRRAEYYALNRITDFTRYTAKDVCLNNLIHGTCGPWEQRFLALCKD